MRISALRRVLCFHSQVALPSQLDCEKQWFCATPGRLRNGLETTSPKTLFFIINLHSQSNLNVKTQYSAECGNPHSAECCVFTIKLHCQCNLTIKTHCFARLPGDFETASKRRRQNIVFHNQVAFAMQLDCKNTVLGGVRSTVFLQSSCTVNAAWL